MSGDQPEVCATSCDVLIATTTAAERALMDTIKRLRGAIETHREEVVLLGHRPHEVTRKPVWGGQYDRDLWAALAEGYPTESVVVDVQMDPSAADESETP